MKKNNAKRSINMMVPFILMNDSKKIDLQIEVSVCTCDCYLLKIANWIGGGHFCMQCSHQYRSINGCSYDELVSDFYLLKR